MNLFAALRVHSGEAHAMTCKIRNSVDLIRFLEEIDETVPPVASRQINAIMDNLSTLKSKELEKWLKAHSRWRLVFTPKHASWLNQVECLFSILARHVVKHGHFDAPEDLAEQTRIRRDPHQTATPFNWNRQGSPQLKCTDLQDEPLGPGTNPILSILLQQMQRFDYASASPTSKHG